MREKSIVKLRPIKIEVVVDYDEDKTMYYEVRCQTKGATVGQLGMTMVALEQVKKKLVEQSEDIEPTFYFEE